MVTVEVTVRITVDVPTEQAAKDWLVDVVEKNLSEAGEEVQLIKE